MLRIATFATLILLTISTATAWELKIASLRRPYAPRIYSLPDKGSHGDATDPGRIGVQRGELSRQNWWLASGKVAAAGVISLLFESAFAADVPTTTIAPFQVEIEVALEETTTGKIVVEVHPEWAPLATKRFEELLEDDFFTGSKFFRVLPGYVAQFGIAGDPKLNKKWLFDRSKALPDEARIQSNKKGTLSFASSGKNSRQTQIFINLSNNAGPPNFLDAQGFVPFARVVKGMDDVVPKLYNGYGLIETASAGLAGSVNQGKAAYYGNEYLEEVFPKLSTIQKITKM